MVKSDTQVGTVMADGYSQDPAMGRTGPGMTERPEAAASTPPIPGQVREPAITLILVVVTLGIYGYIWGWKVSKEMDAYRGERNAHPLLRIWVWLAVAGITVSLIGGILLIVAGAMAFLEAGGEDVALEDVFTPGKLAAFGVGVVLLILGGLLSFGGQILAFIGFWKYWNQVKACEEEQGGPMPLNPMLHLGIWLAAVVGGFLINMVVQVVAVIPLLAIVAGLFAMVVSLAFLVTQLFSIYQVQDHTNRVWTGAAASAATM